MFSLPIIQGLIDRRMLVNFRCDPAVIATLLPPPFRPKLVRGFAIAGICLIRLRHIRPRKFPRAIGLSSENAAHRIAVEWTDDAGQTREGVYVPRRDSSSMLNHLVGGRIFPGVHHHATFDVEERDGDLSVAFRSDDGSASVRVKARVAEALPRDSIFQSLEEASEFFRGGSVGFSPRDGGKVLDGLELRTVQWHVTPLHVLDVHSSFFANPHVFPPGSAVFDNALLMRAIEHEWHAFDSSPGTPGEVG